MKKILLSFFISLIFCNVFAQNVGIGTTEPQNKLQVHGNLLITAPTTATATAPTVAQTKTIINASTINFLAADSTGRIYDPGGPAANYLANLTGYADIPYASGATGIEITAETMGLGTGDSLIIKETSSSTNYLLAVGNGYATTGKWVFNSSSLYLIFKSNGDANTGIGFSLLFKRLYDNSASLPDVSGATGNTLIFDTKNGSFRSGLVNNSVRGLYSTGMGLFPTASSNHSTAMGNNATASGSSATALGSFTNASGIIATAIGNSTTASGTYATAMGNTTTASGGSSTAMGYLTIANGFASTAIGYNTTTNADYSFAMGNSSSTYGNSAIAMGNNSSATAVYSIAMGYNALAASNYSTAMGVNATASAIYARAMGNNVDASGDYSTAMGNYVNTNNQTGAFLIGDNSTTTVMNGTVPNNFRARFANGYRLYTSANYSTSCSLGAGDNAWATGSDVRSKENFAEVSGEEFLKKIAGLHLTSWNYKTQNPATFRHYGPMAQDFYAAFGKDKYGTIGNDTTINSADFAGVSFIAIQALEKRTQKIEQLEKENAAIKKDNTEMKTMLLQLRKEMDALKQSGNKNL